jgi:hypothetical protein
MCVRACVCVLWKSCKVQLGEAVLSVLSCVEMVTK